MKTRTIFLIALITIACVIIVNATPPRVNRGKVAGVLSGSTTSYFQDQALTTLTTTYQELDFGFWSISVVLINDSTNYIEWSWQGTNTAGKLLSLDDITMDFIMMNDIWVRGEKGNESFRLKSW